MRIPDEPTPLFRDGVGPELARGHSGIPRRPDQGQALQLNGDGAVFPTRAEPSDGAHGKPGPPGVLDLEGGPPRPPLFIDRSFRSFWRDGLPLDFARDPTPLQKGKRPRARRGATSAKASAVAEAMADRPARQSAPSVSSSDGAGPSSVSKSQSWKTERLDSKAMNPGKYRGLPSSELQLSRDPISVH